MNSNFIVEPTKLNPKFDGYKLNPFDESSSIHRSSLVNRIPIGKMTNDHRLGFRDLQARIRYSQLIYGHPLDHNRGSAFCIDQDYNLHMILFDKLTKETSFFRITQLVKPLGVPAFTEPDGTVPIDPQMPSAVAVNRELVLTSNGEGDIELIGIEEKNGTILGASLGVVCYMGMGNEGIQPVPCVLLTARQIKDKIKLVVYSHGSKSTEFNIATLSLDIPNEATARLEDGSFVLSLQTLHIQQGAEVPAYCCITPSGERVIFASDTPFTKTKTVEPIEETTTAEPIEEDKTPMYQWSQEGGDITVQFELPPNSSKSAVSCKFVVDHLSLLIQDTTICYPFRKLWSTIRPDDSTWTLENNKLTLFMTKMDEHTRWPQLFDHDDGVSETLSEESRVEIRDRLAKFTSEEEPSFAQHPAATDMDEDIDEEGQPIHFSVFNNTGDVVDEFSSGNLSWLGKSFDVPHHLPSVCLQMDVDGLIFSLTETAEKIEFKHASTLDAFGFVHASKRDARFTLFDPNFNFASIIESSRNAYIYYHHDDERTIEAQTLIDITKGSDVNIIGAQLILENILMVLTESESIIITLQ